MATIPIEQIKEELITQIKNATIIDINTRYDFEKGYGNINITYKWG